MRKLKLEKTSLYLQNLEIKKINEEQVKEKKDNEVKMKEMEKIIQNM